MLGAAVTFMTSGHPWLADVFFLLSGALFAVKFLTWEETRQQTQSQKIMSYGLAIGITLVILCTAIAGNHWMNPIRKLVAPIAPRQSSENPANVPPKSEAPSSQNEKSRSEPSTKSTGKKPPRKKALPPTTQEAKTDDAKTIPSQECPNGICIGGDNNGSATVNNYNGMYPPPGVVPTIAVCISRPPASGEPAVHQTVLRMTTDTPISEPSWWFLFDGPVIDATADADPKPFGYAHSHPPKEQLPDDWQNAIGITVTSIGGISSQQPWRPSMPLTVTVTSEHPINLREIAGRSLNASIREKFISACN
jgi:hypothetical protein